MSAEPAGTDFLRSMAQSSRERVARTRSQRPDRELQALAHATPAPPPLTLSAQGFDLIAEVKRRSPAVGQLDPSGEDIGARARDYALAGAAAISVLTEPTRFDGELAHLEQVVRALAGRVPAMRKDFLVDAYQVYEARAAGAGGVLVILRMLEPAQVEALLEAAADTQQFVLLEAFDEPDLAFAAELAQVYGSRLQLLVGVNCRDLTTLQVVPGRLESLAPRLPKGIPCVAESGVESGADAQRLAGAGYQLALVGSALMRAGDRVGFARELLQAGRRGRRCG
ncbi:MAG TPA: indole-3-glycerol-phosphate synthase [Steroidobacteraceae bacterium]|jgi:indole-3-glycerol phosphate synthase|nr:indole-3-glycerol-phosphate synthase [Steroidobacteraceae bacterium]